MIPSGVISGTSREELWQKKGTRPIHLNGPGAARQFLRVSMNCFIIFINNKFGKKKTYEEIGLCIFPRLHDSPLGTGGESHNLGKRL